MKLSAAHEWLAERVSFIQYPNNNPFRRPKQRAPFFANAMPWYLRLALVFFGICLLLAAVALLLGFGVAGWALFG